MKNKKTKAQKRMNKIRTEHRSILMNIDTDALGEDFCTIVSQIWTDICQEQSDLADDVELMKSVVEYCKMGWNIAVTCADAAEAREYVDTQLAGTHPDEEPVLELIKLAATMKFLSCPDDRVPVKAADIVLEEGGEPAITVVFDLEAAEADARKLAAAMPSMDEILDHDALEKAVAGVSSENFETALKTEIQRQIDVYNAAPQESLGGISPDEAYQRK